MRKQSSLTFGVVRHPRRRVDADPLARHAGHNQRDTSPVRWRPPGVSRAVCQNHVTLALARFPVGLRAVVADQRLRRRLAPAAEPPSDV